MTNLFKTLGLSDELLLSIERQNYEKPTKIQSEVIPKIIEGKDVIATAQTGTGKTAGFTLPMLHLLAGDPKLNKKGKKLIRGLIVVPTRELAVQVHESVKSLRPNNSYLPNVVFGGVRISSQIAQLRKGCDILIATPGRLLDLMNQRAVNISNVEIFVLDEADRMLDMGFIHDIQSIIKELPEERQNLLFSATGSDAIHKLGNKFLNNPEKVEIERKKPTAEGVSQSIHFIERSRKQELLSHLINTNDWESILVFARTKLGADRLEDQLKEDNISCTTIHGNKSQQARMQALKRFKSGKVKVLVATDVASRGIDIQQLSCVINHDLPDLTEDYIHRIGRTGRASNTGEAISLVSRGELGILRDIEKLIGQKITVEVCPGFEQKPIKVIKHKPSNNRFGNNRSGNNRPGNNRPGNNRPGNNRFGNRDSGKSYFGKRDSGNRDSGNRDSGNRDSGNRDSGNSYFGNRDSGNRDSGNRDSGNRDSGNRDSGNRDSGNRDSGNRNSGNRNSGNRNSGKSHFGKRDSGKSHFGNRNEKPKRFGSQRPRSRG